MHLPSIIHFPDSSLEVQQLVDLDVISKVEFDVIEMPTEAVPPKDEVELDLEKLIQESESKLSLIPIPSASLPKGEPNDALGTTALNSNLVAVASKERQNVGGLNTPSFSEIKSKDKESSGEISKQEQGKQFENQSYEIRRGGKSKKANPILPESYFLSDTISNRASSESERQSGKFTKRFEEATANSFGIGSQGLLGLGSDGFFTLSNYQWPYESYMGRWAKHLRHAWNSQPPEDYIQGSQPNGGNVVIQVQLSRNGELESFELISSFSSSILMEESVVNAILSVSQLPPLPDTFQDENLMVRFRFIYPPY